MQIKTNNNNQNNIFKLKLGRMMKNTKITYNILSGILLKQGLGIKSINLCDNILRNLKLKTYTDAIKLTLNLIVQLRPMVTLYTKRVGGAYYKLPVFTYSKKQVFIILKWIINNAHLRNDKTFSERLLNEILSIYKGYTNLFNKRSDIIKIANYGRPFIRFIKRTRKQRRLYKLKQFKNINNELNKLENIHNKIKKTKN